jgi:predicted transcriptional regulator
MFHSRGVRKFVKSYTIENQSLSLKFIIRLIFTLKDRIVAPVKIVLNTYELGFPKR